MGILSKHLSDARLAKIKPYIQGDLLDIGCQRGQLGQLVDDQITSYTGVDISADAISAARNENPHAQFVALNIDQDPLPFREEFDTIVMSALIEHIFNLRLLGEGLSQALKPGGRIVLTTPTPFGNDVVHRIGAMLGLFSKEAADDHIVIFNRKRCEIFAQEFGLKLADYKLFQMGCNQLAVLEK
ncbi:class I SAM-dependent methyltransferase [Hyphococcus sp. DH-69]|uniref:class I SAM-dependent methyltransferase n=1 Tax=Hyphococcus formosus TaxID=3143534 RepID=UPI00398AA02A